MAHEGIAYYTIVALLQVSKPFISKWKRIYAETCRDGLRMGYRGTISYLSTAQREQSVPD
jgi:transposase